VIPLTSSKGGYVLIIAEKPRAASKIAAALGVRSRVRLNGVTYWKGSFGGRDVVIAPAVGHLFTLKTRRRSYPVFEYEWVPRWEADPKSGYVRKYFAVLERLSKEASEFVNACDFDIEGSVIGYLIIKHFGDVERAKRAKFSALTKDELLKAFTELHPLDLDMVEAGLCRHELDWIWGINVSRALMDFYRQVSKDRKVLSAGRVQSPTLLQALRRHVERETFIPEVIYNISVSVIINGKKYRLENLFPPLKTRDAAVNAAKALRSEGFLKVVKEESNVKEIKPLPAFNLPELQLVASKAAGISPAQTLRVAESLYLDSLISYPRTNSQKLPKGVPHRRIIESLGKAKYYSTYCSKVLEKGVLTPVQGRRDDPAHPAIYPTGERPRRKLSKLEWVVYDLIVRRYLGAFGGPARVKSSKLVFEGGGLEFGLSGQVILERGWLAIYKYMKLTEKEIPKLGVGEKVRIDSVRVTRQFTKPPPKYTKATLLKWMEASNIGTEATRAEIVEVLFRRGYLKTGSRGIEVTDLGKDVANILRNLFEEIVSVELTRAFEEKLQSVIRGDSGREEVVAEARKVLEPRLTKVKSLVRGGREEELLSLAGRGVDGEKCALCGRASVSNVDGVKLCEYHAEAYRSVMEAYKVWRERAGLSFAEYLRELKKMRSLGRYSRDVVNYLHERWI